MIKSRFFKSVLFAIVIVGGIWVLLNRDEIGEPADVVRLIKQKIVATAAGFRSSAGFSGSSSTDASNADSSSFVSGVVRIATFRLNQQTTSSASHQSLEIIADICRQYDAIAIQQISPSDPNWLTQLTRRMNELGAVGTKHVEIGSGEKRSDYGFITDRLQNPKSDTQLAIVFNRQTIEIDQATTYTVQDPDRILSCQPLVGCFRVRGPMPDQAFTFTLVNIKIDSKRPDLELVYLGELYRAIRDDGRLEDDVIIAGDFNSGDRGLEPLKKQAGLTWAISNCPTNIEKTFQFDNLVFGESATVEYTGRSGVFDFMRRYDLRLADAVSISDRMPVWAEFSIFEGRGRSMNDPTRHVAVLMSSDTPSETPARSFPEDSIQGSW